MTPAEIRTVAQHFERVTNWHLRTFAENPRQIAELAANELLIRRLKAREEAR